MRGFAVADYGFNGSRVKQARYIGYFRIFYFAVHRAFDFAFVNYIPKRDLMPFQQFFLFAVAFWQLFAQNFGQDFPKPVLFVAVVKAFPPRYYAGKTAQYQNFAVRIEIRLKPRKSHKFILTKLPRQVKKQNFAVFASNDLPSLYPHKINFAGTP
jgi:hypothetical protein